MVFLRESRMTDAKRSIYISKPSLDEEEWQALREPIFSGWLTQGPKVAEFEKAFAKAHGVGFSIATTSCTTALHLALLALNIGPGDEVIVPAFTWVATANAIKYAGAKPVFCDIEGDTYNIDIRKAKRVMTPRTKAVIPVHLFGLCADMDALDEICRPKGIHIIEDAACAAGASYRGRMAGSLGDIGCFSFHPRKIITTGEGGMCTTNSRDLAERMVCLRNHGASISEEERHNGPKPYLLPDFNVVGYNYRMTDLQGAIGIVQLGKLAGFLEERRRWAKWYGQELSGIDWLTTPHVPDGYGHSYQSYVCYVDAEKAPVKRDHLMEILHERRISTRPGTHALHMLGYYARTYGLRPEDFPSARDCDANTLALPLHNRMTPDDYLYVVRTLKEV